MQYVPGQAQAALETDGVRRFTEEELRNIARALAEGDTALTSLGDRVTANESAIATLASYAQLAMYDNRIINGAMMASLENGTTAGTTQNYYAADCFRYTMSTSSGTHTFAQVASVTPGGSPNRVRVTITAADTSVGAGEFGLILTGIEGYRIADMLFGTASAKTMTLRFGVKAPAGTYCVAFKSGVLRSYTAEFTISAGEANTDVVRTITVPGDVAGSWDKTTLSGLDIYWTVLCGSTYQQTAGSWVAGHFFSTANQSNLYGTNGNVFELFDVALHPGSVAPPFVVPDYVIVLTLCKRYWRVLYNSTLRWYVNNVSRHSVAIEPPMRASPALTKSSAGASGLATDSTTASATMFTIDLQFTAGGTGVIDIPTYSVIANARL